MPITVEFSTPNLVAMRVSEVILRTEVDAAKHQMHDLMQLHGPCVFMVELEPAIAGFEALATWEDIEVDHYIKKHIVRFAIVGDLRWRDSAMLFFFSSMVPFQIEYFPADQKELGLAWLTH
ncbi:hypothetical protein os4_38550 (plasmid) [Comamonadaceae bacterium OS-4]|nr:hypothetical protein os4_38550 [Comamonadaceae bacterium OS-4]